MLYTWKLLMEIILRSSFFSILTSRALPKGLYRLFWTVLADEFWLAVKLYRHTGTNWLLDPSLCDCMDSLCCDHWQAVVIVGCLVLASLPTPLPSTPALTQDKRRCVARAFQWTCEHEVYITTSPTISSPTTGAAFGPAAPRRCLAPRSPWCQTRAAWANCASLPCHFLNGFLMGKPWKTNCLG